MKKSSWSGIIAAVISLLTMLACSNNSNKANLLDPKVKYQADTMFAHRHGRLNRENDTLCLQMMDSLVAVYSDSLVELQINQMNAILGRDK